MIRSLRLSTTRSHAPLRVAALLLSLAAASFSAPQLLAANKDMIQLQTQVQQLQDAVARLQQSNDERMGVMKDLVQQTADSVNKMSTVVGQLQQQLATQSEGQSAKVDQVSGQVQSLNDSIDELKARLQRMEKSLGDVQSSQQSLAARFDSGGATAVTTPSTATGDSTPQRTTRPSRNAPPAGFPDDTATDSAAATGAPAVTAATTNAPAVADLYQTAYSDYSGAKYPLAKAEFDDVIRFYPDSNYAGNAYFYLGEMLYRAKDFTSAAKQYDRVIEQFPGNPKIPAAQLHKGQSLLATKQTDAGVRELRSLIQRFPNAPEATSARERLNELGIRIVPKR